MTELRTAPRTDAEVLYRDLAENLFDAVCFVDADRRVTYWNHSAEELTGHAAEQIVGKSCCEDLLVHLDAEKETAASGFFPAADTLADGQVRQQEVYLRHRQGHLVPVRMRVAPLPGDDGGVRGAVEVFADAKAAGAGGPVADPQGYLDPDTGLFNREYLEMRLRSRLEEQQRYGWTFGAILARVDDADALRAAHGTEVTDLLIRMTGKTFANALRSFDVVGRWGEAEFLAIVPILRYSDLYAIGDRIRRLVGLASAAVQGRVLGVTVSVGAAGADASDSPEDLLDRSRRWLRASSQAGGNRVSL